MIIKKKIWKAYFDDVASGRKKFELRLNDFNVSPGDTLQLEEWDPDTKSYTGRTLTKTATHVLKFKPDELLFWPKEEIRGKGLQIISIE